MSARLSGRAKGTRGSVSVTVNRHEELSDRSAPYADFGHGSLFEAAPGARQFCEATELSARFSSSLSLYAWRMVASMHVRKGLK